jgi:hypothetical protein
MSGSGRACSRAALAVGAVLYAVGGVPACSSPSDGSGAGRNEQSSGGSAGAAGTAAGMGGTSPGGAAGAAGATGGIGGSGTDAGGGSANSGGAAGSTAGSGGSVDSAGGTGAGATGGRAGSTGGSAGATGGSAGSTGGSAGATGGTSGSPYNPCPTNGDPCKILPLGDSITEGIASSHGGGYRVDLFQRAQSANQRMTFVGSRRSGPNMVGSAAFPRNHEGYSGWTIAQIAGLDPGPWVNASPDIILLMIGTNDMYRTGAAAAPARLEALLDEILTANARALLVVAQIIPFPGNANVQAYNAAIPALVQKRASEGKHIILVDQFTGFPNSELADGVHPNDTGYRRMAGVRHGAIAKLLR